MTGEPFDVGFILAVGVCLKGQVQVFVSQVETVLQREHAAHVDALAFAVDIGAAESQAADGERAVLQDGEVAAWLDKPPSSWVLACAVTEVLARG